jgi:Putative auto-transporter adhesin, head GIN domain
MRSLTKLFLAVVLIAGTSYTFAKPHPTVKADTIESVDEHLSGFSSIKIAGPFTVHLAQGAVESVKIDVPDDARGRITAEVVGGILKIHNAHDNWGWSFKSWYSEKSVWRNHKKIHVYITAKDLKFISISGSGDMSFNEGITAEALKLRVRGSGSIVGKVDVKTLESSLSGSGNMKLSGSAENSKVRVIGSGNFTSSSLVTVTSAVHVSGSGKAEINASDKVDAAIRGSGDVRYTGTAKTINSSKSGSGEIRRF